MKKTNDIDICKSNNDESEKILDKFKKIDIENLGKYNIFFIGFMGVGKTTVSSYLSKILYRKYIEIDQYIEKEQKMTIPEIFEKYGEIYFRNLETETLRMLNRMDNTIISCGGGIVLREENIDLMKKQGKIILLTATPETVYDRVRFSNERPILNNNMNVEFISSLMNKRESKYLNSADLIIDTDNKSIEKICEEIILTISLSIKK
ncbi:shikimate kinase [Terrisporobacter petrolearius]|uniref:shikimate kinase n=1 Tax=Terrisporobacter petrolearius TaxID=1460447 RepID=UPI001D16E968|nr:shikimate kinase [Terrisporobacter petrolearius]MCC3865766.1 shikimate kinase [Terrisporobacter petrolearius]